MQSDYMPPLAAYPTLYLGHSTESFQDSVETLQAILKKQGFLEEQSGKFDQHTKEAVKNFQNSRGIQGDGWVGSLTWAALLYPILSREQELLHEDQKYLLMLKTALNKEGFMVQTNSKFCKKTEHQLKRFQRAYGIYADGICGPQTWRTVMGQKLSEDINLGYIQSWLFTVEQFLMIVAVLVGMYLNPFNLEVNIPLANAIATSYSLTFLTYPILKPIFAAYLTKFDLPLLKFAPYVVTGFLWRPIFGYVIKTIF